MTIIKILPVHMFDTMLGRLSIGYKCRKHQLGKITNKERESLERQTPYKLEFQSHVLNMFYHVRANCTVFEL